MSLYIYQTEEIHIEVSLICLHFCSLCVLTVRCACELLLHQVWKWTLPGSETDKHIQRSVLLYRNAWSRLGRPMWNLPHQGREWAHFLSVVGTQTLTSCVSLCFWMELILLTSRFLEAYPQLCRNEGYQHVEDERPKGLWVNNAESGHAIYNYPGINGFFFPCRCRWMPQWPLC